jgi:hypothetical protein
MIWIFAGVVPPELVATTVYVDCAITAVGVPEIAPVELSRLSSAGSGGLTVYELTVPVTVGVSEGMGTPTIAVITD